MWVLVACEFSGVVRDAFIRHGHNAVSCDIIPSTSPGPHYLGDVRDILYRDWDLIIAHPPCTYLANSGALRLYNKDGSRNEQRWADMEDGASFFKLFLDAPCPRIAIENPIMHCYAATRVGRMYTQTIQPYDFGHGEQKCTCLWLKGLPRLQSASYVSGRRQKTMEFSPGKDRGRKRSVTCSGIAEAMARQWGSLDG